MPKPDARDVARLVTLCDALASWADGLTDDELARPAGERTVSALVATLRRRGDGAPRLTPDQALTSEVGAVQDALALAEALPDHAPTIPRTSMAAAVRTTLFALEKEHPGHLVEVRVPPFGAVQIGMPGVSSVHRRGTPPNVVETDAATWLALVAHRLTWDDAVAAHKVSASGAHAQLRDLLGEA